MCIFPILRDTFGFLNDAAQPLFILVMNFVIARNDSIRSFSYNIYLANVDFAIIIGFLYGIVKVQ